MRQLTQRVYPAIGHLRLDKITGRHVQQFINDLALNGKSMKTGKPLSRKTAIHHLSFISDVFSYAVKMDMLSENPCRKVTVPKVEKKEKEIYTLEEIEELFRLLETAPLKYRTFFTLAIYSGFRRGELLGLEWKDIDWEHNVISVRRTSNYTADKGIYTDTTKTKKSQRSLKFPPMVMDLLKQYKSEQDEEKVKLGSNYAVASGGYSSSFAYSFKENKTVGISTGVDPFFYSLNNDGDKALINRTYVFDGSTGKTTEIDSYSVHAAGDEMVAMDINRENWSVLSWNDYKDIGFDLSEYNEVKIIDATEDYIVFDAKAELERLEEEQEQLEVEIAKEQIVRPIIPREHIEAWIMNFAKTDLKSQEQKQRLIDIFVNSVYVYDDKVVVLFNYKDGERCIRLGDVKLNIKKENTHKRECSSPSKNP